MRLIKKIFLFLIGLLITLAIAGFIYTNSLKPQYSGSITLKNNQNEVVTYFDDYGIPHIYAETQQDAYRALGYVHAQDRLWQMELVRRIAPARLSEILGKDLIKTDKFFAALGIEEASKKAIDNLDKNSEAYEYAVAYLDGVNQFIDEGPTPVEFTILGVEKEHYTLTDMYNVFGYMAFSFAQAQKTDPFLSSVQSKLGPDYLKDLDIDPNPNSTLIKTTNTPVEGIETIATTVAQITETLPVPLFVGSNSWVVSPSKTNTGNVLFANDPHIGFAQPSVWYEAHIVTPDYEIYGYHLAGIPFPMLAHNREYAYGMTMFENDDLDFYQEQNHPTDTTKYKTPDGYETYKTTTKTIKVKDEESITFTVKSSRHGPIMNGIQDEILVEEPIAVHWIYTQLPMQVLEAVYKLSHASGMQDIEKAASMIHAPGLNLMYGDAKGNVAWWAAGQLYTFEPHVNSKFVLDGTSGEDDIREYLDFEYNPRAKNPDWNYVYSANNQPDSIAGRWYPGYYLPEDRAKRIVNLLEQKDDWSKDDFKSMLIDNTSAVAPDNVAYANRFINESELSPTGKEALAALKQWDGNTNTESIAPTIYYRFVYRYLENTFKDELEDTLYKQLLKTHLLKRSIPKQMQNSASKWWDNVNTPEVIETQENILTQSFSEAVNSIENTLGSDISLWKWGKVHTIEHPHALGVVEALRPYFNVGPFETGGSQEVIDNKGFHFKDTVFINADKGPSTRRIVDFSDVENSLSILPTGQSGNPFSKHYHDQAEMYAKGEFRPMLMNKEKIQALENKLVFKVK